VRQALALRTRGHLPSYPSCPIELEDAVVDKDDVVIPLAWKKKKINMQKYIELKDAFVDTSEDDVVIPLICMEEEENKYAEAG
jgi:hypothetical protein